MTSHNYRHSDKLLPSVKIFHELMPYKVKEILLVSSSYDAFIMEEDGRLAGRIIHEYRGLNLSRPPRLTWVSSAQDALATLKEHQYDILVTMPRLDDMDIFEFGEKIKRVSPDIPIILLTHTTSPMLREMAPQCRSVFDRIYVWRGNTDLLVALIKNVEDRLNVEKDTKTALVRVILLVEDSPLYASSIIPLLYREVVLQTQRVMEESVNEEHRLLRMRARPKILLAETWEEALALYHEYKPFIISVISDIRFPKNGEMDDLAGIEFLRVVKQKTPHIALLNLSSDDSHKEAVLSIPAAFINKNSTALHNKIRNFFMEFLGFGDFIFRLPNGKEVGRARNLKALRKALHTLPNESLLYHAARNDFSIWLMARSEIELAAQLRPLTISDFSGPENIKAYLISCIEKRQKERQKGVVMDFTPEEYDPEGGFTKLGTGSMGGKARGLAFMASLLYGDTSIQKEFPNVDICIPKTFVITTEEFDLFMDQNELKRLSFDTLSDVQIKQYFLKASFSDTLTQALEVFLAHATYPLAVRSSSLMEDSQSQPFAGIYKTYMLPNIHSDFSIRYKGLTDAIKLVFASTYLEAARSFAESTLHRVEEEKMAVIVQQIFGQPYGDYFYPAISGVVHSYNFYPVAHMLPEEGVAHIALGLGKTVMDGGVSLRFSPKHPEFLPGFSSVDEILNNAQRSFYALNLSSSCRTNLVAEDLAMVHLEIDEVTGHYPVSYLCDTYVHEEHRIRPSLRHSGYPVLTFSNILKGKSFPLAEILSRILDVGRKGMGGPVEIEFAVDFSRKKPQKFAILQIRPLILDRNQRPVKITPSEIKEAVCVSDMALGNGWVDDIEDIIFVKPDSFDPGQTIRIAEEIGTINYGLKQTGKSYLLIGFGRWGSADRWLGIPVKWQDISSVKVMVEVNSDKLKATPSQGAHFFHNITSMGISYITIQQHAGGSIDWSWLSGLPVVQEKTYVKHVTSPSGLAIKVDGKNSKAVVLPRRMP